MTAEIKEFISKGRFDALTDGVFAFAIGITLVIERDIQRRLVRSGRPEYSVLNRFGYSLDGNRFLQPG